MEHETLAFWRERGTFARLRSQNAGGPHWCFLDGPITANNPMGVHHAWGRTYKDAYQRYFAMTGHELRYQNGFDCQGLWVEVEVEKELGFTSKRDIENLVPATASQHRPASCKRARTASTVRRAADRAVDPPRLLDGLGRPRRAAPAGTLARSLATGDGRGPDGP